MEDNKKVVLDYNIVVVPAALEFKSLDQVRWAFSFVYGILIYGIHMLHCPVIALQYASILASASCLPR